MQHKLSALRCRKQTTDCLRAATSHFVANFFAKLKAHYLRRRHLRLKAGRHYGLRLLRKGLRALAVRVPGKEVAHRQMSLKRTAFVKLFVHKCKA